MAEAIDSEPMGAAMEGDGFYNRNSRMQAAGVARLLPYWIRALNGVPLDGTQVVVADYASSQGRNSMAPMKVAIEQIRARAPKVGISIVHTDLPTNDFTALFSALDDDTESYLAGTDNVYALAVGRSYFQPLFPAATVLLGWNTWSVHWMSGEPIDAPDHVLVSLSKDPDAVAKLKERQAHDWTAFLGARAHELRAGGRLLTAFVAKQRQLTGWEYLGAHFWGAILDLRSDGLLSDVECRRLTVSAASRTREEILDPFGQGAFRGLSIEEFEIVNVPDPHWDQYQLSGDREKFGESHADGIRAWAGPDLLRRLGSRLDASAVLDRLFKRIADRVASDPQPHTPFLAVLVLKKSN